MCAVPEPLCLPESGLGGRTLNVKFGGKDICLWIPLRPLLADCDPWSTGLFCKEIDKVTKLGCYQKVIPIVNFLQSHSEHSWHSVFTEKCLHFLLQSRRLFLVTAFYRANTPSQRGNPTSPGAVHCYELLNKFEINTFPSKIHWTGK